MKLLAQKSLKTELRLKRYRVFKLYGLKCKISKLKTDFLLNQGLKHNLIQAREVCARLEFPWINRIVFVLKRW
jgi:hypothetical protein